jgi:hypothetical protein
VKSASTAAALDLAPKLLSWFALRVVVDCDRGAVCGESRRNPVSDAGARASHDRIGARKTSFFAHMQTSSPRPHINPQTALSIPCLWCFWVKSGTYRTQFQITLATESLFRALLTSLLSERRSASVG